MTNVIMQNVAETQDDSFKSGSVQYINSREIAEMVGKEHRQILKDIRRYTLQLNEGKISPVNKYAKELIKLNFQLSDFFIESSYNVEEQSNKYQYYLVAEKAVSLSPTS